MLLFSRPVIKRRVKMLNSGSSPAFHASSLRVAYLPFLLPLVTGIGVVLAYILAVCNDHILPVFPYISDLGAAPPEGCLLSMVLNLSSFLWLIIAYLQFVRTGHLLLNRSATIRPSFQRAIHMLNLISVLLGVLIAVMLNITANFPWHITPLVHMMSTIGGFFLSILYTWVFAVITLLFSLEKVLRMWLVVFRMLLVVIESACFVLVLVMGFVARSQFGNNYDPSEKRYTVRWGSDSGGFAFYITATSLECVMVGCVMLFIATFSIELHGCRLTYPSMHDSSTSKKMVHHRYRGSAGSVISGGNYPRDGSAGTGSPDGSVPRKTVGGGFVHITTTTSRSGPNIVRYTTTDRAPHMRRDDGTSITDSQKAAGVVAEERNSLLNSRSNIITTGVAAATGPAAESLSSSSGFPHTHAADGGNSDSSIDDDIEFPRRQRADNNNNDRLLTRNSNIRNVP